MKTRRVFLSTVMVASLVGPLCSEGGTVNGGGATTSEVTVVTSDKLTFDNIEHYALFEGNVVVVDPRIRIEADWLEIRFDEKNRPMLITARGAVRIEQRGSVATAGEAVYEVGPGRIVLKIAPRVRRGRDLLEGEQIVFWRDENKMVCGPSARLVIYPEEGGVREMVIGE
ncbi:MAG TPA: hypothetical protein EYP62_08690 [Kiritimatiellae bacterium]|nr:hypothetical protein [Kiritimatiellia bacterium]